MKVYVTYEAECQFYIQTLACRIASLGKSVTVACTIYRPQFLLIDLFTTAVPQFGHLLIRGSVSGKVCK